jgi:hypothetical protein
MGDVVQLRDVFTPGGLPSVTYVSRDNLELESKLLDALARGFAFIVVTGPTKSGKTVLCRRVLERRPMVIVEGGQVRSESDFWNYIAYELQIASNTTTTRGGGSTSTVTGEGGGGLPGFFQAKTGLGYASTKQNSSATNFENIPILAATKQLIDTNTTLLVDDFHYIEPRTQKLIIQSLKSAVFKGLPVVLLAVPHRAFDPVTVEKEVEGRFKHIEIPQWALDDLILIPNKGFPALNVEVERSVQRRICEDSFGNPLLVQEICSEFSLMNRITEIQSKSRLLDSTLLEPTYRAMADSKGFPIYQKLKRGTGGRRRKLRPVKGGGEEDIYAAILTSVARLGPKSTTGFEDIRESLREIFAPNVPMIPKGEIIAALNNMSTVARTKIEGEPPLEWIIDDERLEITDPFLLFCLKWTLRNQ